jgi:HEAT repeat protein
VRLLQLRGAAVVPELRSLLTDPNRDLRKLAVDVLSRLTEAGIDDLYEIALRDQDANVVITALENMRRCLPESQVLIVQHAVQETNPMLALAAMDALIRVGNRECLEEVRGRFPDPLAISPLYAPAFLRLVASYGGQSDVHFLLRLLKTNSPRLQPVTVDTLRALLVRTGTSEVSDDCWKVLLACLPRPKLAGEQYEVLSLLGHFAGREQVFKVLVAYLQSPEKLERIAAIEALGRYRPDKARTALMACMAAERDPEVREALREAGHVGQL